MHISRKFVGLSAVNLFSAAVAVIPATAAHAAGSWWDAGFTAKDPLNSGPRGVLLQQRVSHHGVWLDEL